MQRTQEGKFGNNLLPWKVGMSPSPSKESPSDVSLSFFSLFRLSSSRGRLPIPGSPSASAVFDLLGKFLLAARGLPSVESEDLKLLLAPSSTRYEMSECNPKQLPANYASAYALAFVLAPPSLLPFTRLRTAVETEVRGSWKTEKNIIIYFLF